MQSNLQKSSISLKQSGNGGGYEGMTASYYHFVPNYTCEGSPSAEQITEIKNGQAFIYENQKNKCAVQSEPVSITNINISPFQNEFISVNDSLFKRYDEKPAGIPNNIAEVLCRDDFNDPSFEIISHFDREKNEALTRVYFPQNEISDFSVSRILSSSDVRYVSSQITFKVDLSKPIMDKRKFSGLIESSSLEGIHTGALICVIGGSIDTSNWMMKELTQVDAGPFQLLKNNEIMFFSEVSRNYFSASFFTTVKHLFKIGLDNIVSDFSKLVLGGEYNVMYRLESVADNLTLFYSKTNSEMWPSLYVYGFDSLKIKKLTNLVVGSDPEAFIYQNPVLTNDQHLFYDQQVLHSGGLSNTAVLRVYDFKSDQITEITNQLNTSAGYKVLPITNNLLIFWPERNQTKNVIQIYDAQTKLSRDMAIQLPDNCVIATYKTVEILNETAIVTAEFCDGAVYNVIQVSLLDGSVKTIVNNSNISWNSVDKNWLVITDKLNTNRVYDVRTGKLWIVPIDPRFGYNAGGIDGYTNFALSDFSSKIALVNDQSLYGFGGSTDSPIMYRIDLTSGVSETVCDEANGKKLFVGILPDQKIFLFTYDPNLKVYRFYQVKSSTECQRINEFPSEYPNALKLISTNIGFGLLLGNPLSRDTSAWSREAVFVPIDGRPPLKFNSNTSSNWEMEVSADKNRIVLRGPAADGILKIFSFDL